MLLEKIKKSIRSKNLRKLRADKIKELSQKPAWCVDLPPCAMAENWLRNQLRNGRIDYLGRLRSV